MTDSGKSFELVKILEDNAGIIYKLSFMYANSKEEAEDLQQEIRYQVVKSYDRFKGESKISTWIYKVALFTALSALKSKKREDELLYEQQDITDSQDDENWQELIKRTKRLLPVDRSLVFLYLENKSYKEIAEIMGITESNVGVRLNRIKKKLKEMTS